MHQYNCKVSVVQWWKIIHSEYLVIVQGNYTCACKPFYKGDGQTCTVDNACELGEHNCGSKDWCSNMGDGKFTCAVSSLMSVHTNM